MTDTFDFVVIGAGSAGAAVAARLTEDANVSVCLLEAGAEPPPAELIPAGCAGIQHSPADWDYHGDAGKGQCLGFKTPGRMHVPQGKMLGGSSGINYMAWVRGHPGDFDKEWGEGWSWKEVLPYFKKQECFADTSHVKKESFVLTEADHGKTGPIGVTYRKPIQEGCEAFLKACKAKGLPIIDYNSSDRGGQTGGCSHIHCSVKDGKRSSTYHAYLEPNMGRPNLKIITGALVTELGFIEKRANGVHYKVAETTKFVKATKEVIVSAGSYNTPALLMRSGIGPKAELDKAKKAVVLDSPHVGKHLRDHLMAILLFPAPGLGKSVLEVFTSLGSDALRGIGVLPSDPSEDNEDQKKMQADADKQIGELMNEGRGLAASSLYDAVAFYNTGLGDAHTHDAQIACLLCGYNKEIWEGLFSYDINKYFGSPEKADEFLGPTSQNIGLVAHAVKMHSEGSVTIKSSDPHEMPSINFNYLSDKHDTKVFVSVIRRTLEIGKVMEGVGAWWVPTCLRDKHKYYDDKATVPDALLEDYVRHFPCTVYHAASTCRIGDVVDKNLHVKGIQGLRVVDASVMPNVVSGNTNAASIMIGEKGAEMIGREHKVALREYVDGGPQIASGKKPDTLTRGASSSASLSTNEDKAKIAREISIATGLFMTAVTMVVPTRAPMVLKIKNGDATATVRTMGMMSAVAAVIELIVNPVLGKLADDKGRKPFLMLAPMVNAILHGLVAIMPNSLPMQFIDRMISGSMIFGYMAPAQAAMADLYAKEPAVFGANMARTMSYFGVGCALGPFLGSKLEGAKSFAASAVSFVLAAMYINGLPETLAKENVKKFKASDINPVAFLKLFKDRTLAWLALTTGLQSFGDYVNIYDINNLFMIKVLGYDQYQIGNFATTVGLTQIAGGQVTSRIIKKFGLKSTTAFSNLMWIIGMAMMGSARNTQQAFTALFIWTFGHQRNSPVAPYLQTYGSAQGMGKAEIVAATGNMNAYIKVMIPILYSNIFAWATSGGRNMPGLPYFTICVLTALSQAAFLQANPEDK